MLHDIVRPWVHGLLDLIYPRQCLLCCCLLPPSEPAECLCAHCLTKLPYNRPPFCAKCSRPLKKPEARLCRHCAKRVLYFDRCWCALSYSHTVRHLVHLFKYAGKTGLRRHFARFLIDYVKKYRVPIRECDLIIPVPLHPARFRERGFNQSELIAHSAAQNLRVMCSTNCTARVRYTPNQARVNSKQRWTNMQGTFRIRNCRAVRNKTILVIDDVLTTGATLSEIALALKSSGAKTVYGLTAAAAL